MRLIDADALIEKVCEDCPRNDCTPDATDTVYGCMLADSIDQMPTIEPEVRHGRWIPVANGRGGHECERCRNYAPSYQTGKENLSDDCPYCGAKMDGGADNG